LLHLDVHTKFVQYIKLAVQECGLGLEWVRAPRLPLMAAERKQILKIIHHGIAARPKVPKRTSVSRNVADGHRSRPGLVRQPEARVANHELPIPESA
jgi:hypothetical protein